MGSNQPLSGVSLANPLASNAFSEEHQPLNKGVEGETQVLWMTPGILPLQAGSRQSDWFVQ